MQFSSLLVGAERDYSTHYKHLAARRKEGGGSMSRKVRVTEVEIAKMGGQDRRTKREKWGGKKRRGFSPIYKKRGHSP